MYRMSPDDYREISAIWRGPHPEDGSELRVVDGPPEGGPVPVHPEAPQLTSPIGPDGIDPRMLEDIGARLFGKVAAKKLDECGRSLRALQRVAPILARGNSRSSTRAAEQSSMRALRRSTDPAQ